jgi:hypothetical protein
VPAGGSGPLPSGAGGSELERIRAIVAAYFPVYETRVGPQSLLLAIHPDPATLETKFDALRRELWPKQYVPLLRRQSGEEFIEVVRRPPVGPSRTWINLLLLAGTVLTTTFAGALIWLAYVGSNTLGLGDFAYGALYFAAPVLLILGLHEFAHFWMARRHHLDASLPYFIPVPPPLLFGTLGAFISIREPFPDKKALFDVGVAGPLAGFAVSIPIAIAGLFLSVHAPSVPASYCGPTILGVSYGNLLIGTPLLWLGLQLFVPVSTSLSPLALAGWVGILVTAINLLPAGQLDGGHVFRALFGDRVRWVSYGAVLVMFGIGIFFYAGWLFFALLILLLGVRHPPPLNDLSPLDWKRGAIGAFAIGVLVVGFVLTPLATPAGAVAFQNNGIGYPTAPPGAAVYTNLSTQLANQDPLPHGFVVAGSVVNVSVPVGNSSEYLTGAAFASWTANVTWTVYLPHGAVYTARGASFALPSSDFLTINGTTWAPLAIGFASPAAATSAGIDLSASEFCALTGGSASTSFAPSWDA